MHMSGFLRVAPYVMPGGTQLPERYLVLLPEPDEQVTGLLESAKTTGHPRIVAKRLFNDSHGIQPFTSDSFGGLLIHRTLDV